MLSCFTTVSMRKESVRETELRKLSIFFYFGCTGARLEISRGAGSFKKKLKNLTFLEALLILRDSGALTLIHVHGFFFPNASAVEQVVAIVIANAML